MSPILQMAAGRGTLPPMRKFIILDAGEPQDPNEAFIVCGPDWNEQAIAAGENVFAWGSAAWNDDQSWAFSLPELRAKRPGMFERSTVYGVLVTAQSRGYTGPASLPALGEWAGVANGVFDLATPLGRCALIAQIMKSPRMKMG